MCRRHWGDVKLNFDEPFPHECVFAWITKVGDLGGDSYVGIGEYTSTYFTTGDFNYGTRDKVGVWIATRLLDY